MESIKPLFTGKGKETPTSTCGTPGQFAQRGHKEREAKEEVAVLTSRPNGHRRFLLSEVRA